MKSSKRVLANVSRRQFVSVAAGVVAGYCIAPATSTVAVEAPTTPRKKAPLKLGLASYSLRKFDLDKTMAMTRRVGLKYICLKSMHLPLEATPAQIAAAAAKVKAAGLVPLRLRRGLDEQGGRRGARPSSTPRPRA